MSLLIEMVSDSSRSAEVCEGYYQLLVSIYFKNNNPNKQQLIKSFNDLMSRDIYEIVVWLYSIKSLYTLFILGGSRKISAFFFWSFRNNA